MRLIALMFSNLNCSDMKHVSGRLVHSTFYVKLATWHFEFGNLNSWSTRHLYNPWPVWSSSDLLGHWSNQPIVSNCFTRRLVNKGSFPAFGQWRQKYCVQFWAFILYLVEFDPLSGRSRGNHQSQMISILGQITQFTRNNVPLCE